MVEHLTFNQVVRGSNPRTLIVEQANLLVFLLSEFITEHNVCIMVNNRRSIKKCGKLKI